MLLRQDDRGNFAVLTAIAVVPLMCAVGLSADYLTAISDRSAAQNVTDAVVLAAAKELSHGSTVAEAKEAIT